jgi:hypothetical protein
VRNGWFLTISFRTRRPKAPELVGSGLLVVQNGPMTACLGKKREVVRTLQGVVPMLLADGVIADAQLATREKLRWPEVKQSI